MVQLGVCYSDVPMKSKDLGWQFAFTKGTGLKSRRHCLYDQSRAPRSLWHERCCLRKFDKTAGIIELSSRC